MDKQYIEVLYKLKGHIRSAQQSAIISVNIEMLFLYWEIGQLISQQKKALGWGTKVVKQLSQDLSSEFSNMKGFSVRNLNSMLKFAETYSISTIRNSIYQPVSAKLKSTDNPILQTVSAKLKKPQNKTLTSYDFRESIISKITWSHHIILMNKVKNEKERFYYMQRSIKEGWSSRVLTHKIEQKLFQSQGKIPNNFDTTLPEVQSELAKQTLKDHYIFDFLSIGNEAKEREIENALLEKISKFLLELGKGFAFLGQQYHLEVGGQDFYLDLLFFHTELNCYFIIELKIDDFKPEYTGKLNFYLNSVDAILKKEQHQPTIGLLLCKSTNKIIVEYSLKDSKKPIGIATYKVLPKKESFIDILNKN